MVCARATGAGGARRFVGTPYLLHVLTSIGRLDLDPNEGPGRNGYCFKPWRWLRPWERFRRSSPWVRPTGLKQAFSGCRHLR